MILVYSQDHVALPKITELRKTQRASGRNPDYWHGEIEKCTTVLVDENLYPNIVTAYRSAGIEVKSLVEPKVVKAPVAAAKAEGVVAPTAFSAAKVEKAEKKGKGKKGKDREKNFFHCFSISLPCPDTEVLKKSAWDSCLHAQEGVEAQEAE